jgi:hypothetical protein
MNQIDPETTNKISLIQKETFVRTGKIHDKIEMVTRNIHINQLKRKHNKKLFELSKKKYNFELKKIEAQLIAMQEYKKTIDYLNDISVKREQILTELEQKWFGCTNTFSEEDSKAINEMEEHLAELETDATKKEAEIISKIQKPDFTKEEQELNDIMADLKEKERVINSLINMEKQVNTITLYK